MLFVKRSRTVLVFAMIMAFAMPARAHVTQVQQLNFGKWAITDNDSTHAITVDTNGNVSTSSNALVMIESPQPGIYTITGLPAFTAIGSVNVTMTQPMRAGGGPDFTMDDFQTVIPDTNSSGETTLTLGATASTSGTDQSYEDNTYSGDLFVEINL